MPNVVYPNRAPAPVPQARAPQPTQWQPPAQLASGISAQPLPTKVRGVSGTVAAKFVLPPPEALGVANLNLPRAEAPRPFVLPPPEALGVGASLNMEKR
jgi:hypothetical protein